jgi:hypothetical protein
MKSLTLRRAALTAVAPLALGSLAACGGGSGSSATAADTQPPSSQTSATTSSTPSSSDSSDSSDSPTPAASGSAVSSADFVKLMQAAGAKITTAKVAMTGDESGQTYTMKGTVDLTGDKPAMDLTMNLASSGLNGIEMRLVGNTMYMSLGSMTQGKFVKFDLNDPNGPLGSLSGSLDNLDPSKIMGDLGADSFKKVTYVGSDASGKHYRATLVTAKSPQIKGLPSSATANLPKTMAYDVWLDSQGRFSKFEAVIPKTLKMTALYTDYGTPAHITAPPASQVTQLPGSNPSL